MFKKGQSGNPAGKKPGTKNKNCMNPVFWFNLLEECLSELTPTAKMPHVFRALELLMPKVPSLPATHTDAAQNAATTYELLNGLAPINIALESKPSAPQANGNGDAPN